MVKIVTKEVIHQGDIINTNSSNTRALKQMKQKLTELKGEIQIEV